MSKPGNIIIGISGGIAAYKTPLLIRLCKKAGFSVKVVCTRNALHFVTPLTLETLSQEKVYSDVFSDTEEYTTEHISLTDKADAMIVAPATANIIAKFAHGIADDALSTTFLSFNKQVFIAPAMNTKMYENEATQKNIDTLKKRGVIFIEPDSGFLACGYDGKGRMSEPEQIFTTVMGFYDNMSLFLNKNVLVTAGPTQEPIDPVRFIGNRSSGKMGFALAEAFALQGARVTLISGPVNISTTHPNIQLIPVKTADEMFDACKKAFPKNQLTVMSAAVADYAPAQPANSKLKKHNQKLQIELKPTPDILKYLGSLKKKNQILVGFALESDNETKNAIQKLNNKNLDCIVLNSLKDKGSGFEVDTNKVTILTPDTSLQLPLMSKKETAMQIVNFIAEKLINKT